MQIQTVCLQSLVAQVDLKDGVAKALDQVIANIQDLRTQPDKSRKLLIEVEFTPNEEDRHDVAVDVQVATKLAPILALHIQSKLGREGQAAVLKTMDFAQQPLYPVGGGE